MTQNTHNPHPHCHTKHTRHTQRTHKQPGAHLRAQIARPQGGPLCDPAGSEEGKALSSCQTPLVHFFPSKAPAMTTFGVAPLKRKSFRCLHMLQTPRIMSEFRPFRTSLLTEASTFAHQLSKDDLPVVGASRGRPTCCRREPELPGENTPQKEVLYILLSLVTQQAPGRWMGKPSPC